jgi:hypothetical protein
MLVHNADRLNPYEIVRMGDSRPTGPGLQRHELLENGWFRHNGHAAKLRQSIGMALKTAQHRVVNGLQRMAGLHDPATLKGMDPELNMLLNADIMDCAGVPEEAIEVFGEWSMINAEAEMLCR